MIKCLLVRLDGTPQSASALPFARLLARQSQGRMALVRIVDPVDLTPQEHIDELSLVLGYLQRIASELQSSGVEVGVGVSTGEVCARSSAWPPSSTLMPWWWQRMRVRSSNSWIPARPFDLCHRAVYQFL
jgi:hypothetical protein